MSEEDPIKRAASLPPPTIAEAICFHIVRVMVERWGPEMLDALCESARDKATVRNVIALHGRTGDREWEGPFLAAEIRIDGAAAMIRAEREARPPSDNAKKRKKKRKKR